MTKKEVCAKALEICAEHKASKGLIEAMTTLLAPKVGGATINLDEVTRKDSDGNVVEIMCSVSGRFLPATAEFFYEEKAEGKGINGLKRLSRQAEAIRKAHLKVVNASEKAIMADVLGGNMTPEDGKEELEKIKAVKPDFSDIG